MFKKNNFIFNCIFFFGVCLVLVSKLNFFLPLWFFEVIALLVALYILLFFNAEEYELIIPYVLIMGVREVSLFFGLFFLYVFFFKKNTKYWLVVFSFFIISLIQISLLDGDYVYGFARVCALYFLLLVILNYCSINKNHIPRYFNDHHWITLFYLVATISVVCKFVIYPNDRLSPFNGSENIGYLIVTLLFYKAILSSTRTGNTFLMIFFYGIYLGTLESRSSVIYSILIAFLLMYLNFGLLKSFFSLFSMALIFNIFFHEAIFYTRVFIELGELFALSSDGFIQAFSVIDVRGGLLSEGFDLISNSPIFGNGVLHSSLLDYNDQRYMEFHNSFLDIVLTLGFLGFVFILISFYFILLSVNMCYPAVLLVLFYLAYSLIQPVIFNHQTLFIWLMIVCSFKISYKK